MGGLDEKIVVSNWTYHLVLLCKTSTTWISSNRANLDIGAFVLIPFAMQELKTRTSVAPGARFFCVCAMDVEGTRDKV